MKKYLIPLLYIIPAVVVFAFLGYSHPWLMTVREDGQLWLFSGDYLLQRLSEPGGLARYVGEFFVQFCYYVAWGAAVMALLFLFMQWLWWLVVRRIWRYYHHKEGLSGQSPVWLHFLSFVPHVLIWLLLLDINVQMTLPVAVALVLLLSLLVPQRGRLSFPVAVVLLLAGWWLAGPIVILLPFLAPWSLLPYKADRRGVAGGVVRLLILVFLLLGAIWLYAPHANRPMRQLLTGIDYVNNKKNMVGTPEEQQYCLLVQLHLWNRLISVAAKHPPKSRACKYAVMLAEWKLWNGREQELLQCLHDTWGSLSSCAASLLMSELYLQIGWFHMSQRAAHDAMVSYPNYNNSGRALKRLAEMNLVTGHYDLVRKYAFILEQAPFYRSWARDIRQMADHPELIERNASVMGLRSIYHQTPDGVFY